MLKILYELHDSKEMAAIYTNTQETTKFHYGKVVAVNDREVAILMISPDGIYDGVSVFGVEKVYRVETRGQYAKKMEKLCSAMNFPSWDEEIDEENILKSILSIAQNSQQIVSFELVDSGIADTVGLIEKSEEGEYVIRQIDEYGFEDGYSYISLDIITGITVSSEAEKRIMRLWNVK